ncbi:divalent-cation tolerance protein CutA [Thalassovita sp.]|uniref:divalent-cation tolerance protein CutA n=1 Tax=Thalassovita sp. TaxID=1979401 RepID=UPI0029DE6F67|nr:divalent-cation tolerance protein CutA [Thalassovita sp.]
MPLILSVTTLCPDHATAAEIADTLLARRLVACANIHAPCESRYHWQGAVQRDTEIPLVLKTRPDLADAVQAAICALHPYDVPAILCHDERVNADYTDWVAQETAQTG